MNAQVFVTAAAAIVALAALVFSVFSFSRQQRRADIHARASVKPLLSIRSQNYDDRKSIRIVNSGVGPAIIKKVEFRRGPHGPPTNKLVDLFSLPIVWETFVNVPANRVIPAEGEILLIKQTLDHLRGQGNDEKKALALLDQWKTQKTGIHVHIEYEDIYSNAMTPVDEDLK
jgi:hypothetical protein